MPSSKSKASPARSGTPRRCAGSTCRCPKGEWSRCSGRTARARPPSSASCRPCSSPTRATARRRRVRRRASSPPRYAAASVLAGQYAAVDETLTGRENLEMVGRLSRLSKSLAAERAAEVLERVSLTDAADRPLKTYSGGMRRRIDLGAGLVARPRVLLLDEPTTGLDPANRLDLWAYLRDLVNEGCDHPPHHPVPRGGRPARVRRRGHRPRHRDRHRHARLELKQRLAGDVLDVTVDDADLERVVDAAGRRRPRATDRRPRHAPGVAPRRRWGAAAWSRWCAASTRPASRWSTSPCAGRRSTTCSSPSPGTRPCPAQPTSEHADSPKPSEVSR